MKRFVVIPQIVLLSVFWVITSATISNPPPVASVVPKIDPRYMPDQPRPDNVYCEVYVPPDTAYKYCTLPNKIHLIIKDQIIHRTYVYIHKKMNLTVGQLINEWGEPSGAYYAGNGALTIYWPGRFAGLFRNNQFSPYSQVAFIGYGAPLQHDYGQWRGFINNYVSVKRNN
jgi:hypothetical protein